MFPFERPRCQLSSQFAHTGFGGWWRHFISTLRQQLHWRSRWRTWWRGRKTSGKSEAVRLGAPSRFAAGSWVRVRPADEVLATLTPKGTMRGLSWVTQQWPYCGTVHRVFKPVRRMLDDSGQMRAIAGTVLLDTVPCSGMDGQHGCGRDCPMMFRDEWLEEVPAPRQAPPLTESVPAGSFVRVRSLAEIFKTLDMKNERHGLLFMPEMSRHAGQRFKARRRVERVPLGRQYVEASEPVYLLEGLHCTGAAQGENGPCERACRLLWHADWLAFE